MEQILSTSQWNDVHSWCLNADEKTWVIWDVDNTLIFANDIAFCGHDDLYKKQLKLIETHDQGKLSALEIRELWYQVRFSLPSYLMDKAVPNTIRCLQEKKIVTFALTYLLSRTQKLDCTLWRSQQLKHLGIDFTPSSPLKGRFEFTNILHNCPVGCPTLSDGIFYSHHCDKGECLEYLIEKVGYKPEKIIFIDDSLNNVKLVAKAVQHLKLNFLGIEFSGYLNFNPQGGLLDKTLLDRWENLKKTNQWCRIPILR